MVLSQEKEDLEFLREVQKPLMKEIWDNKRDEIWESLLMTPELAEILGMFAADGCLQKQYICMWGNIYEDKDYYDKIMCPLYSKVFEINITAHEKKSNSVYGFYVCNKKVIEVFKKFGFTNNKTYDVRIPKEVIESENPEVCKAFIRGFVDCDGSFSLMRRKGKYREFKLKYNTYPRIEMTSVSKQIIIEISQLLTKLGILHKINAHDRAKVNEKESFKIMIRGNDRIEHFMYNIGFHNPSKIIKYEVWKKFGFCPSNSNIEQRKLFLNGQLNPYDFYKNP